MSTTGAQLMTQAEYARHRQSLGLSGGSREAVRKALDAGRITAFGPDKLIDATLADAQWVRNTRQSTQTNQQQAQIDTPADDVPFAELAPDTSPSEKAANANSFQVARTLAMSAQAQKAQLDLAQKQGLLLEREQIERDLYAIARELRDRHTNTARRIAAELANTTSADACETILLREFNQMLIDTVSGLAKTTLGPEIATALDLA